MALDLFRPVPQELVNEIDHQMVILLARIDNGGVTNLDLRSIWLLLETIRMHTAKLTSENLQR
jgi:hypothetical protein